MFINALSTQAIDMSKSVSIACWPSVRYSQAVMSIEETLRRRSDIPDEHVEELISRASRLQDDARKTEEGASESEIVAVAQELDIDPQYVEAAIAQWRNEQEDTSVVASRARVKQRGKTLMKGALILGGLVLVGVPVLSWVAWATLGAPALWAIGGLAAAALAGIVWLFS